MNMPPYNLIYAKNFDGDGVRINQHIDEVRGSLSNNLTVPTNKKTGEIL
jgi:hypothetical protein